MNALLTLVVSNVAVACALAVIAWSAGRWLRRPALTHGLWLLVFVKLLTPPLIPVAVIRTQAAAPTPTPATNEEPAPAVARHSEPIERPAQNGVPIEVPPQEAPPIAAKQDDDPAPVAVVQPQDPPEAPKAPASAKEPVPATAPLAPGSATAWNWSWLPAALGWTWLAGSGLWFLLAVGRIVRFHRLLRHGEKPTPELSCVARGVARRLGVRCPRLVLVPGAISPMLWGFGRRPRLVLPVSLVQRLMPDQWRTLLAHELAHWRRRDHWARWLELIALGVYWWCPLVWWAKLQLQQAEEECCDAWVVSTLPEAARDYAIALVETVDFLSGARAILPPAASGLGHVHLLQRRVTMILRGQTPRALTVSGLLVVLTLGLLAVPLAPTWAQEVPVQPPAAAVLQKEDKVGDKDKGDQDKARQELQRIQDEFLKLQRQMDQRRRELEEKLQKEFGDKQRELAKQLQEAMQKAGFPGGAGAAPGFGVPGLQPGAAPPFAGGLQPNLQPPLALPGAAPGFGGPRPDLERRLDELERKLDKLIEKLGGKAPGAAPNRNPNDAPAAPGGLRRAPAVEPAPPAKD